MPTKSLTDYAREYESKNRMARFYDDNPFDLVGKKVEMRYCPFCSTESGDKTVLIRITGGYRCDRHGDILDMKGANLPVTINRRETPIEGGKPRKFYAGAKHIGNAIEKGMNAACTRDTFEQAVEDAREYMQRDETLDTVVVVEIVAVVRREKPQVTIQRLNEETIVSETK